MCLVVLPTIFGDYHPPTPCRRKRERGKPYHSQHVFPDLEGISPCVFSGGRGQEKRGKEEEEEGPRPLPVTMLFYACPSLYLPIIPYDSEPATCLQPVYV